VPVDTSDEGPAMTAVATVAQLSDRDILELLLMRAVRTNERLKDMATALENLLAANTEMKQEVVTAMANWATALQNANSANDPAIQQVADDINQTTQTLIASDPMVEHPAPDTGTTPTPEPSQDVPTGEPVSGQPTDQPVDGSGA
jgi:ABC-type transporter Mla subunit MlaD